ncbi:MAG TPA: malto-oligosyltrehalose synthase [Acidobacteriaceae bacterium]|jgi:(1->4)-alpha-D-glucan 1-alpha-D-glucosylmutase|nr:malto-oligosyltrehalose synthase [Acidobacteriaceae bacterium]
MRQNNAIRATYRLQLTPKFTFADVETMIPYLAQLGISHIYSSPILAAKPGSEHGYDICDHSLVNPVLGGEAGLERMVQTLHRHDMGFIVDFVPNHMSADPQWNLWWRDLLANGPSSPRAEYFDVDWFPVKDELAGKVLLPILGKQYGEALESGELQMEYRDGEFCLNYYDTNLPLNPRQMRLLFRHRLDELVAALAEEPDVLMEYQSILFQLDHLPHYLEVDAEARTDRQRETAIAAKRLQHVIENNDAMRRHIQQSIKEFNGKPGHPESFDLLHALLEEQAYRLSYWRTAVQEINYRRFFDVNELVGLRMEHMPVFHAAHAKLVEFAEKGWIDGVRLDHIDGLFNPQQYLVQLRQEFSKVHHPMYILVEKILARGEPLNSNWPVEGTTGYDFLALINGLWVQEQNQAEVEHIYRRFLGKAASAEDFVYEAKRLITATSMASELNVLAHELNRLSEQNRRSRDFTLDSLQEALREVVACFPVYRTYLSEMGQAAAGKKRIDAAIELAALRNPSLESSIFHFIGESLFPERREDESDESFARRLRFAMKFQQYTSPVQAKGIEDTVFYRHCPLVSINEVGSGTKRTATTPEEFHRANERRLQAWPQAMLATATHDTKRGEDARLRIHVLTELPDEWRARLLQWSRVNAAAKTEIEGVPAPDRSDEYLFYQSLLGAWPMRQSKPDEALTARMKQFMNKALKEAKVHTSWINPSNDYDAAMEHFVEETLRGSCSAAFLRSFLPFARRTAVLGAWSSVSQVVLKLSSPGVPDTYQGTEFWDTNLVDPDNRRPVDYVIRQQRLELLNAQLAATGMDSEQRGRFLRRLCRGWWTSDLKLLYLSTGLQLRRQYPEVFLRGAYYPLQVQGRYAEHVIAFAREQEGQWIIVIALRWFSKLLQAPYRLEDLRKHLQNTLLELPCKETELRLRNPLTGGQHTLHREDGRMMLRVGEAVGDLPAVWLQSVP